MKRIIFTWLPSQDWGGRLEEPGEDNGTLFEVTTYFSVVYISTYNRCFHGVLFRVHTCTNNQPRYTWVTCQAPVSDSFFDRAQRLFVPPNSEVQCTSRSFREIGSLPLHKKDFSSEYIHEGNCSNSIRICRFLVEGESTSNLWINFIRWILKGI